MGRVCKFKGKGGLEITDCVRLDFYSLKNPGVQSFQKDKSEPQAFARRHTNVVFKDIKSYLPPEQKHRKIGSVLSYVTYSKNNYYEGAEILRGL